MSLAVKTVAPPPTPVANKYEILLYIKPVGEADTAENCLRAVEGAIRNQGGQLLRTDRIGRKKTAYKVGKYSDAAIAVVGFSLFPDKVTELKKQLRLIEDLIRFTLARNDKLNPALPFVANPITGKEPREPRPGGRGGPRGSRRSRNEDGDDE